jgi:hypothetical protein
MIVIATREDLRDEITMADEAFALSPISARATQPREEDYDAISEAFMETSRGRWFLGEYAKRNRNADTRMVLDAIARIEESMAAQRQAAAEPDNGLAEALVAIRHAVDEGRAAAFAAVDNLALEESLAPIRKGTRVIKEIAWRWREIGADSRICDLLDSQAGAIEGACGQIASADPHDALSAAFEVIEKQLTELGGESAAASPLAAQEASFPQAAEEATAPTSRSPSPAPSDELPAAVETTDTADDSEAVVRTSSVLAEQAIARAEAADVMTEAVEVTTETLDATADAAEVTAEAEDITTGAEDLTAQAEDPTAELAYDDAMLDMVAAEMAAPDVSDVGDPDDADMDEFPVAELPPVDPEIVAQAAEPIVVPAEPPAFQPSLQPSGEVSIEPSLGSALIANGILRKPSASGSDPLAPIRRMSQAEKIAFFS